MYSVLFLSISPKFAILNLKFQTTIIIIIMLEGKSNSQVNRDLSRHLFDPRASVCGLCVISVM